MRFIITRGCRAQQYQGEALDISEELIRARYLTYCQNQSVLKARCCSVNRHRSVLTLRLTAYSNRLGHFHSSVRALVLSVCGFETTPQHSFRSSSCWRCFCHSHEDREEGRQHQGGNQRAGMLFQSSSTSRHSSYVLDPENCNPKGSLLAKLSAFCSESKSSPAHYLSTQLSPLLM